MAGKIAIVTVAASVNEDDFHSVDQLIKKYGEDRVIHAVWPVNFMAEKEQMIKIVSDLAANKDINILIFNQAVTGTNAAVDKLKETRDDIFIVYCSTQEPASESITRANLIIEVNYRGSGHTMVKQAKKQGAKVFVHYSFARHMALHILSSRRDSIRETCLSEGLLFLDVTALDPTDETGSDAAHQFIENDVTKLVQKYGEDTAFFCSNCHLQTTLIKAVIKNHALYPQPCCPSLNHGFLQALGIKIDGYNTDVTDTIIKASHITAEKNMSDRLSTWPVSAHILFTNACAEYAISCIEKNKSRTTIDNDLLLKCMNSYIEEAIGEESSIYMSPYIENGTTYNSYKLILMSYLDF